jgi:hypothetical protein
MDLFTVLISSSKAALKVQAPNGSMPAGVNGPYQDPETPVRNTSHWLISFLKAYEIEGEKKFLEAAEKCLSYLMSAEVRPMNATFWHRKNPRKDFANGVMGQAWTLEALEYAYRFFGDEKILISATNVFKLHPYDNFQKAWETVNVDGSIRGFDTTFNHQLWFAAIGSRLASHGDSEINNQTDDFLNSLGKTMKTYHDGVIMHHPTGFLQNSLKKRIEAKITKLRTSKQKNEYTYSKSVGYHGFNLYALGLIHEQKPDLVFFNSSIFKSMIKVSTCIEFMSKLEKSKYSFDYNPPGFELGFAMQKFGNTQDALKFLEKDTQKSFDFAQGQWGINNKFDQNTAAARVYEVYQLQNVDLLLNDK